MKSLEELAAIRDKMKNIVNTREADENNIRVVVGMATCGIAAGARPVLNAFTDEVARRELANVTVTQTGCIGICQYEPVVEVYQPGKEKVTYVKMTAEKAARVVGEHLVGGKPVDEYTIGALFMLWQYIVPVIGLAYDIDPFDQPGVRRHILQNFNDRILRVQ